LDAAFARWLCEGSYSNPHLFFSKVENLPFPTSLTFYPLKMDGFFYLVANPAYLL
jgi:hypothetical protein